MNSKLVAALLASGAVIACVFMLGWDLRAQYSAISYPVAADPVAIATADLDAQRTMASWSILLGGISAFGLIVSGIGIWFVRLTLVQAVKADVGAERAIGLERELRQAEARAYLSVDGLKLLLYPDRIDVTYSYFNAGQTVARGVDVSVLVSFQPDTPNEEKVTLRGGFKYDGLGDILAGGIRSGTDTLHLWGGRYVEIAGDVTAVAEVEFTYTDIFGVERVELYWREAFVSLPVPMYQSLERATRPVKQVSDALPQRSA